MVLSWIDHPADKDRLLLKQETESPVSSVRVIPAIDCPTTIAKTLFTQRDPDHTASIRGAGLTRKPLKNFLTPSTPLKPSTVVDRKSYISILMRP